MVVRGEGTFEHLDDRYRRYAALPDEERIAWIKADRWIGFDQAQAALDGSGLAQTRALSALADMVVNRAS